MWRQDNPRRFCSGTMVATAVLMMNVLLGCGGGSGSQSATVSGKVSVNGTLLHGGKIVFRPLDPSAGSGGSASIVDGEYRLEEVPLGENIFMFSGWELTGRMIQGPGGKPEPERASAIPKKVLEEGVKRSVEGDSTLDFALGGPA